MTNRETPSASLALSAYRPQLARSTFTRNPTASVANQPYSAGPSSASLAIDVAPLVISSRAPNLQSVFAPQLLSSPKRSALVTSKFSSSSHVNLHTQAGAQLGTVLVKGYSDFHSKV